MTDTGTSQQALLAPAFDDPHLITTIDLTGPEGSLFSNIDDPTSLHAGAGVSITSPIFLSIVEQGSAEVNVTSETIGVPVSEPDSWALLALPLVGLLAWRGRFGSRFPGPGPHSANRRSS